MRLAETLTNQNAEKGPQVILNGFSLHEKKKNPGNIAIVDAEIFVLFVSIQNYEQKRVLIFTKRELIRFSKFPTFKIACQLCY